MCQSFYLYTNFFVPHEAFSVFDMFKIGVGPSSSHTLGPWRAAQRVVQGLMQRNQLALLTKLQVLLYGSLAKTGKGHGTDVAILLGLCNEDPETIDVNSINPKVEQIKQSGKLVLAGQQEIDFVYADDLLFLANEFLSFHPNAVSFLYSLSTGEQYSETWYSIGGGFVVQEGETTGTNATNVTLPFPINTAE